MSSMNGIEPTGSAGGAGMRGASNIAMGGAQGQGLSPSQHEATDTLAKSGIKEGAKGLQDGEGNKYTFDAARDKLAGMIDDKAGLTGSAKSEAESEIRQFVKELQNSQKPQAQPDEPEQPQQSQQPEQSQQPQQQQKGGQPEQGSGSSPSQGAGASGGAGAADAMPDDLLGMLDDEDQTELQNLIDKMKAANMSAKDIKAALKAEAHKEIEAKGGSPEEIKKAEAAADAKIDKAVDKSSESDKSSSTGADTMKTYG